MFVVIPLPTAHAEDAVIEDESAPDATYTTVTLAWDANPEQNISSYNVYYGRSSGSYSRLVTVSGASAEIGVKGTRTIYFAVTAVDTNGVESEFSDEVQWP